jgi:DNA-binding CsgD family transcriptional regulator
MKRNATAESQETRDGTCSFCEPAWAGISLALSVSKREVEILQCLVLGDSEGQAADFLGISRCTVHTHLMRVYNKLGVHSRAELIVRLYDAHGEWQRQGSPPLGCHLNRRTCAK